jgi:hypothetical protein
MKRGEPVADLARTAEPGKRTPKLGFLKGEIGKDWESDDWWKPMTEEESAAEGWYGLEAESQARSKKRKL